MPETYKALVIGSGAGGAPAAFALAQAWGDGVGILEAGLRLGGRDFTQVERDMVPRLYAGAGTQATEDGAMTVLQGAVVGGSTVINDGLCFRPPPEIYERWRAYGVTLSPLELDPFVDEVEAAMNVTQIPRAAVNKANYLVALGAARLGWHGERLRHNAPGCVQCGFRHIGCAYDAKQSMNLSFVPRAEALGARLHPDTRALHLSRVGGLWRVETSRGELQAERVVLAAGVVQTPTLLLRSGIEAGQGTQFHVETLCWGDFDEPVDGFAGIPMSYGVFEFADVFGHQGPGYLLESVAVQPLAFSTQHQAEGDLHVEIMRRYRHMTGLVPLLRSKGRGRVRLGPDGRAAIDYPLVPEDATRLQHFFARGTELFLAAGARRVLLAHRGVRWVTAPPQDLPIAPGLFYLYTAHPFGGANRGTVTDEVGRVKGQAGLWVLDGSAFPEALGVNPQITIAALALQGGRRIVAEG